MDQVETTSVGNQIRTMEHNFISGTTKISEHVNHSLHDTIEQIYAYTYATHISGKFDALGREKPFFDIGTAAVNVWYRATDIDRRHIRLRASKSKDWIDSFLMNILLQAWMKEAKFGQYLNQWGRTLARFGSAITKIVEFDGQLFISVVPWNRIICDAVAFGPNAKIELLELTEDELRSRVDTHGYDAAKVEELCAAAKKARETTDRNRKDNNPDYYKLYEFHGQRPLSWITEEEADRKTFVQQMQIVSFVDVRKDGRHKSDYKDFVLYAGREEHDPYRIDHLIEEDNRTLSIGAIEHLFEAQWMMNHSQKQIKDMLDLAAVTLFQTNDSSLVGHNVLNDLMTGDIFVTAPNTSISAVATEGRAVPQWSNYAVSWKQLGNEIVGVSEAMLGHEPKSGTAWRQTEAILQENYNLFELMTENKGLAIEEMLRERIIPHFKKSLDTTKEVSARLEANDIERLDARFIKNMSHKRVNEIILKRMDEDPNYVPTPAEQQMLLQKEKANLGAVLAEMGNERFFKPSDLGDDTWRKQFENTEVDIEADITGENFDTKEAMATLNTALKMVMTPGFEQNKRAQNIVGRILELTNAMSPVEYYAVGQAEQAQPQPQPQPQQLPQPAPAPEFQPANA
jgi:hypothetical protein